MKRPTYQTGVPVPLILLVFVLSTLPVGMRAAAQDDPQVERGRYLVTIAGCLGCHTPIDPETFQPLSEMLGAGGQPFDLGPLGVVYTKNLTSDPDTGLGSWTDEEIKTAFMTGVSRDGLHLFPLMPYRFFNHLSDDDADAIIAYLRTLPPVNNAVERRQILPVEALPALPRESGITAPDPSDTAARAEYLFSAVLACTDCHTPLDPGSGAPIQDAFLAGGQPYEGPWGIVYGGNITPDETTGIGRWSDAEIERVIRTGVRPDGRVAVLMPWPEYKALSTEDMQAVLYYLRNEVPPVDREVPAAELDPAFVHYVELPTSAPAGPPLPLISAVAGAGIVLIIVLGFLMKGKKEAA